MVCHTRMERKEGHAIHRQIGKDAPDKGNPVTLGHIHTFPTSQPPLDLFNDTVPNRLGLIGGPQ